MPSLNLEDFGENLKKPNSEEMSKEEVENYYLKQITQIKRECEEKLKKVHKEAFEEGYLKGKEDTQKTLREEFEKQIKEKLNQQKKEIQKDYEKLRDEIVAILKELSEKYKKHIQFVDELILSVLQEVLEYLYIDPKNVPYVSEEIKKIIDDLKKEPEVTVHVPPELEKYFSKNLPNIKIVKDESMKGGDFLIKIENVQLENRFKEKVKILRDEIKREIKKNSPL